MDVANQMEFAQIVTKNFTIMDYQYPEMDEEIDFSDEFIEKVNEQRERLHKNKCSH